MAFEFTVDIAVSLPVASLTPSSQQPQTVFCKSQSKIITFIESFSTKYNKQVSYLKTEFEQQGDHQAVQTSEHPKNKWCIFAQALDKV